MSQSDPADKLARKYGYWEAHPDWPIEDWQYEVANGDTRLGYWEWVVFSLPIEEMQSL